MQPYNAARQLDYFQCCCHPRTATSLSYSQTYEAQFQAQLQAKKPFKSPFSIESLLGGETSHELASFSTPSAKQENSTSIATKLKALEDRRRNNITSMPYSSRDKTAASPSAEMQKARRDDMPVDPAQKESPSFVCNHFKHKRPRTMFTLTQLQRMEREFMRRQYITGSQRVQLADELQLSETQVRVWFQNRRIKWRKEMIKRQLFNGY